MGECAFDWNTELVVCPWADTPDCCESPEARDARAEQAHESRNSLHREGFADND